MNQPHNGVFIRPYCESDASHLWLLFYDTVRQVNIRDYSQAQVEAWAPDHFDAEIWQQRMDLIRPFIAEINGEIVGYADLQDDGLIDHFFCHHQYQGQGVGRSLMQHLLAVGEQRGLFRFYSEVSQTACSFYLKFGFKVIQQQMVHVRGQQLKNYVMEKLILVNECH